MYAQVPRPADIPRNYSGNAFRYPPIGSLQVPAASDLPPADDALKRDEVRADDTPDVIEHAAEPPRVTDDATAPLPQTTGLLTGTSQGLFGGPLSGLLSNIGSEELLLIGLFLLLSGGEGDGSGDILFYLLLLLFCG